LCIVENNNKKLKQILSFGLIILLSGLAVSCYPEWKLAKSYIESKPELSIMIFPTDYVFKINLKRSEIGDTTGMTSMELDSTLEANSLFLKNISDSIFLETFINSMIIEFEKLGFDVYTENYIDSFLFFQSPAYIFNIAQIELEEHYLDYEDEEEFGDNIYHKSLDLDAVSLNSWFELSKLNGKEEGRKLFYTSETIADIADGYFTENIFTGKVQYKYQIIDLDVDIIYRYAEHLGQRYAGYTFDYILNEYIKENFPPDKKRRYYMRYNRPNNTLDPASDNRFIILEE